MTLVAERPQEPDKDRFDSVFGATVERYLGVLTCTRCGKVFRENLADANVSVVEARNHYCP